MADRLILAISEDGAVRARIAHTDTLVAEALRRHQPGPLGALALARALSVAAVFPVEWEKNDRISLQWSGGGPLGTVFAELRATGDLRAYLSKPSAVPKSPLSGERRGFGLGLLPGGFLGVLRQSPTGHTQGQVPLINGEIDEDLESYFEVSEQVPTRVRALVAKGAAGEITAAGAVLVQHLPQAEPETLVAGATLEALTPGTPPEQWLETAYQRPFRILEERPLRFGCPCTRERVEMGLALLSEQELLDMMVTDQGAEVDCQFCAENYRFTDHDLAAIIDFKAAQAEAASAEEV